MRKILKILTSKEVGSIGIGAMIVFIAMVLVAGIAASVLIQTSTRLEMQAMHSGSDTIAEVSTGLSVEFVTGHYSNSAGYIDLLGITVRPRAGSQYIDLSQVVIEISDSTTKNFLTYDSNNAGNFTDTEFIDGDIFSYENFTNTATEFSIIVLKDADSSCSQSNPAINRGDHVILGVNVSQCFGGLANRKDIFGTIFSEQGSPGVISFCTPALFTNTEIYDLQ